MPDADAFLYFDSCKCAEVLTDLEDVFGDDFREKLEEKSHPGMEKDEIEQFQKDVLKATKTLDLRVMMSMNTEEREVAFACLAGKDETIYEIHCYL